MAQQQHSRPLWREAVPEPVQPRAALAGDLHVDVAVVGAGYTGLWTAYYLHEASPSLRIAIVEAETAGFGASGRNGGWCSALYPVSVSTLAGEVGSEAATAQYRAMHGAVDEVQRVVRAECIDADLARGGTIVLARTPLQLERARAEVREYENFGLELQLLDAHDAQKRLAATSVLGGTFTPACAALHPAKLVRGLARCVVDRGVQVFERTRAQAIEPHRVRTGHGSVHADVVVRATEGYTARLPRLRRAIVPVYSLIIATEPLSDAVWDSIGLRERETFSDFRHLIIYGQRTADGRMVFGGRGAPYHYGSRVRPSFDSDERVFTDLHRALVELFPVLSAARITHRWGGPLGIARDWHASVGSIAPAGSPGRAATSATAYRLRILRAGPSRISSPAPRPNARNCRGSVTALATGNPNRCGGSARTPACTRWIAPTASRAERVGRRARRHWSTP